MPAFTEVRAQLDADGYAASRADDVASLAMAGISTAIATESECANCGHYGLDCRHFTNASGAYRVVAVCPACSAAAEL